MGVLSAIGLLEAAPNLWCKAFHQGVHEDRDRREEGGLRYLRRRPFYLAAAAEKAGGGASRNTRNRGHYNEGSKEEQASVVTQPLRRRGEPGTL
ncbi:uncharacterized protein DS421_14g453930 [Arachis hypogaea]|nr:uncharacterized protein DS421_14g453930 [Arachis hypogaea]